MFKCIMKFKVFINNNFGIIEHLHNLNCILWRLLNWILKPKISDMKSDIGNKQ